MTAATFRRELAGSRRPLRGRCPRLRGAAPQRDVTPAAGRGGEEGGQGRLVHLGRRRRSPRRSPRPSRPSIPGIEVQVERSGAERIFQRIGQEYGSNIHNADVVERPTPRTSSIWKQQRLAAAAVPADVAQALAARTHATPTAITPPAARTCRSIAYNTKLVKPEDAPKSFADLLDPKWKGKHGQGASGLQRHDHDRHLRAQPRRSAGTISRSSASSRSCRCSPSTEPPKKLAQGERPVMADGNEYNVFLLKEKGAPVEIVYADGRHADRASASRRICRTRRIRTRRGCSTHFLFTQEAQQLTGRRRRAALGPSRREGKAGPQAARRDQAARLATRASGDEGQVEKIKKKYERVFRDLSWDDADRGRGSATPPATGHASRADRQRCVRSTGRGRSFVPAGAAAGGAGAAAARLARSSTAVTDDDGAFTLANFAALVTDPTLRAPF